MVGRFAVYCLTLPQTVCIIDITRCCLPIGKANQLIQAIIGVFFCLTLYSLADLISVGIIGIYRFFCTGVCGRVGNQLCGAGCQSIGSCSTGSFLDCLGFLLQQGGIITVCIIVIINSLIFFRTSSRHLGTVAVVIILIRIGVHCCAIGNRFFRQPFQPIILVGCCLYYTTFIAYFASIRTI